MTPQPANDQTDLTDAVSSSVAATAAPWTAASTSSDPGTSTGSSPVVSDYDYLLGVLDDAVASSPKRRRTVSPPPPTPTPTPTALHYKKRLLLRSLEDARQEQEPTAPRASNTEKEEDDYQ